MFLLDKTAKKCKEEVKAPVHIEKGKDVSVEAVSRVPALDELLMLKINLALTETVDYPLPRVIGD